MMSLVADILVILILFLMMYLGFHAGIIRSFFAVTAGFVGILLAENYPYQSGINYYLIFFFSALIIFLIGIFIAKVLEFICLSLFDKIAGAVLCLGVWFVLTANFLIPTMEQTVEKAGTLATGISQTAQQVLPMFNKYVPEFFEDKKGKISTLKEQL